MRRARLILANATPYLTAARSLWTPRAFSEVSLESILGSIPHGADPMVETSWYTLLAANLWPSPESFSAPWEAAARSRPRQWVPRMARLFWCGTIHMWRSQLVL